MSHRFTPPAVLMFFLLLLFPGRLPAEGLDQIVARVQKSWDETRSFTSGFRQTVESKLMGTKEETTGKIFVQKPDKFRWESESDGSLQIINGKVLTFVQPKAQRGRTLVDIYPDFRKRVDARFLDFLAGNVKIEKLYKPKLLDSKGKTYRLELVPRTKGGDTYIAEIDKKSYLLHALSYETDETSTRMELIDPQINRPVEASQFDYQPKKEDIVNKSS